MHGKDENLLVEVLQLVEGAMGLRFCIGDATQPTGDGPKILCHVCNDIGSWGRGFVLAISARWSKPEARFRAWHREGPLGGFSLGAVQFVAVADNDIEIANMISQHGIRRGPNGKPPICYNALGECLERVATRAKETSASVHMPRIGAGLAGGDWDIIEQLIRKHLCEKSIHVTVYDPAA